jgi:hypothetical protein
LAPGYIRTVPITGVTVLNGRLTGIFELYRSLQGTQEYTVRYILFFSRVGDGKTLNIFRVSQSLKLPGIQYFLMRAEHYMRLLTKCMNSI